MRTVTGDHHCINGTASGLQLRSEQFEYRLRRDAVAQLPYNAVTAELVNTYSLARHKSKDKLG